MSPIESELLKAVAYNPQEVMPQLMSPQVNFDEGWFENGIIKSTFKVLAQLTLSRKPISWLMVSANLPFVDGQREQLRELWQQGKVKQIDWKPIVEVLKTSYIQRQADKSIQGYYKGVKQHPQKVVHHLGVLGVEIGQIAHKGVTYNPDPTTHFADQDVIRSGTWGDKVLNEMFSERSDDPGGRPNYGFVIASMPTGHGKSTLAITMAAYGLAYGQPEDTITIMSNESPRSVYSRGVLRALHSMYGGQESDEALSRLMKERLLVYGPDSEDGGMPVKTFELMRQILFWTRPKIAVMDSLNSVSPPQFAMTNRKSDYMIHEIKADAFRDTCLEYGVLLYSPGNMSDDMQTRLKDNPSKVSGVMLFGSKAYENAADYSFLGWRDKSRMGVQQMKRCKNRHGTSMGEVWSWVYDMQGGYYRTQSDGIGQFAS